MPNYQYQPYYHYKGLTRSDPFPEELPPDEVSHRIRLFFEEIGNHFENVGAQIENIGNGTVSITTEITQAECDVIVKNCLNDLELYAKKIQKLSLKPKHIQEVACKTQKHIITNNYTHKSP